MGATIDQFYRASSYETEQAMIVANRKLIEIYECKIQAKLAEIWGEEK